MTRRSVLGLPLGAVVCRSLLGAKYDGPRPAKRDIPYLMHADNLVETDSVEAKEEPKKDDLIYWIPGTTSTAKTPLAGPIFLIQAEKINPERLQLYQLSVQNGRREVFFSKKKPKDSSRPIKMGYTLLDEGLYRLDVVESLENGEYALSPDGSNQVFTFEVF